MVLTATVVAAFIISSGRSAWFVGVLLMLAYAVFVITLYLLSPRMQTVTLRSRETASQDSREERIPMTAVK